MLRPEEFYPEVYRIMMLPAPERHAGISHLHTLAMTHYVKRLNAITEAEALTPVTVGDDQRTVLQIVGHIAEWERFAVLSASDILIGIQHPRLVTALEGHRAVDGTPVQFENIDQFNAYFAEQQASWTWEQMRPFAIDTTTTIHQIFTNPLLLNADRLERTRPWRNRFMTGEVIHNIGMGWTLWLIVLEHIATEHVIELGLI